jgi:sorting nexin-29
MWNYLNMEGRSNCENYRGISLPNVGYKIYAKIINKRLQTISDTPLLEEQNEFRPGSSCIDNVFTAKQIIEKIREQNLETHIAFIDFEKAFDRVNRLRLWEILQRRGYPKHLVDATQSL